MNTDPRPEKAIWIEQISNQWHDRGITPEEMLTQIQEAEDELEK